MQIFIHLKYCKYPEVHLSFSPKTCEITSRDFTKNPTKVTTMWNLCSLLLEAPGGSVPNHAIKAVNTSKLR